MENDKQFWEELIDTGTADKGDGRTDYHLFRHESGKLIAVLTRIFGTHNLALAEDVVQDTLIKALDVWKIKGIPDNPSAWLFAVARNKVLDTIRREKRHQGFSRDIAHLLQSEYTLAPTIQQMMTDKEIQDDMLRMMFACCHPDLAVESQVAMILKTLCGFGVAEVAKAFLTTPETIEKRLYRARQQFREEQILFEIPTLEVIDARLDNVLLAIYLLFNEGYTSTQNEELIRRDLLDEAMRLAQMLAGHPATRSPKLWALLALMCFTSARNSSRLDEEGNILLLKDQDRKKWDQTLIRRGIAFLNRSSEGEQLSAYHIEAAIAFEHCSASSYETTRWDIILRYYDLLYKIQPTPVVALNRAIVISELNGPQQAIREIQSIPEIASLRHYYLLPATLGELYARAHDWEHAQAEFRRAIALTRSEAEKRLLSDKIRSLEKNR